MKMPGHCFSHAHSCHAGCSRRSQQEEGTLASTHSNFSRTWTCFLMPIGCIFTLFFPISIAIVAFVYEWRKEWSRFSEMAFMGALFLSEPSFSRLLPWSCGSLVTYYKRWLWIKCQRRCDAAGKYAVAIVFHTLYCTADFHP